ncbi:MAG: FAD-binding protein [Desulfomonile tiedjei]|nr:FAD-binding protein [Desulfomonile tiedjei]
MDIPTVRQRLKEIVGDQYVLTSDVDLMLYGYDAYLEMSRPDVVVIPGSTEEVSRVAKLAYEGGVPVTARGSGTSLSGGPVPLRGGIVIHFSRMNRILEIDVANKRARVEPGVITLDLQTAVAKQGLQYAPDPASQKTSTLGGNVGENSGGPHCLKYGVTTNHIMGLKVVLYDGTVVDVGGKAPDRPGYDLTGLMVGSEGTLGIITEITLRLIEQPEEVKTLLSIFETIEDAGNTVSAIIAEGIVPATLEMMDRLVIKAVEESVHAGYPQDAEAVLIIELDGLKDGMQRLADRIVEICRANRVREVRVAKDEAERNTLWTGRRGAFGAMSRLRPSYMVCDGTVPRTKLPEVLKKVTEIGRKYNLPIGNVFHAGDGNLHPLILFDIRDEEETARVKKAGSEILRLCVDAGGTISGEHGIGLEKLEEMSFIFSQDDVAAMWKLKNAFDPAGQLNPGKVLLPVSS